MMVSMLSRSLVYRRSFSVASRFSSSEGPSDDIPEPTWSIKDLQLSSSKDPVSIEELERLARKSLLDVSKLQDPYSLRKDLANMLHCLEQVRDVNLPDLSDAEVYDVPRGVTSAPLRNSRDDVWREEEQQEAKQVWETFLKHKTIQRGAHSYFSVVTKLEDAPKKGTE
jgi:hypothetical protein